MILLIKQPNGKVSVKLEVCVITIPDQFDSWEQAMAWMREHNASLYSEDPEHGVSLYVLD